MRRSPVPSTVTDPEQQRFLDELYKRQLTAIEDVSGDPSSSVSSVSSSTISAVDSTAAISASPFGYSEAQANAIVTQLNLLIARVAAIETAVKADTAANVEVLNGLQTAFNSMLEDMRSRSAMGTGS